MVGDITEFDAGNRAKFNSHNIRRDKKFFEDSGLIFNKIKEKIESGVDVSIVVLNRGNPQEKQESTLLHETYLHLKKLNNADAEKDHIEGFGAEAYPNGIRAINTPEKISPNSNMGKIENRYKNAKLDIEKK